MYALSISPVSASHLRLAIVLPDFTAIQVFRHLCFALRRADPDLPEVYRNDSVGFFPADGAGSDRRHLSPLIATLTILEREHAADRDSDSIVASVLTGKNQFSLVTTKATFFNYLSPRAIEEKLGIRVEFNDKANVRELVARALFVKHHETGWERLDEVERNRRIELAGYILAEQVAPAMTPELLLERRAKADVGRWLDGIKRLIVW